MDIPLKREELRTALRFILHSTSWASGPAPQIIATVSEGDSSRSPNAGIHALIKQVQYSRRFILYYHVVLNFILLIWAVVHWDRKARRAWKRRRAIKGTQNYVQSNEPLGSTKSEDADEEGEDESNVSSSSSSTLKGTMSPLFSTKLDCQEEDPLLPQSSSHVRRSWIARKADWTQAWLAYQPMPLPIINKTLPSNRTTLAVILLWAINMFFTFYRVPFSPSQSLVFADRAGLVFVVNLPYLYFFAAKNQPLKILTGYSYESCNILHRRLGEIMCLLALLHSVGMVVIWYTLLRSPTFTLTRFLLSKIILLGIGALVAYEALYFTSLGTFRRKWYELFLGLHVSFQIVALILLWFHHHGARIYVGLALAIFIIDRLVYRMTFNTATFKAALRVEADKETVSMRVSIPLSSNHNDLRRILCSTLTHGWKPTHHVFLTIPSLSPKHILQAHPFTIASRAPSAEAASADLDLIIRAQSGFSSDLLQYAGSHSTVAVRLDGPYGSQQAVDLLCDSDLSIVVAGGSGIAVAYPLVWSTISSYHPSSNLDLEVSRPINSSSLYEKRRTLLIWIDQKPSYITWVGEARLAELRAHGIELVIPPPTLENGRPDVAEMVESWIVKNDQQERGWRRTRRSRIGVVCSGPDGMNRAVRNWCGELMARGWDVGVEIEKVGW